MAETLLITKKSTKTWLHQPSDELQFIIGKFTFSIDGDFFQIVELGQSKRNKYNFSDITVYDETTDTTYDSFTSIVDLSTTLETLAYPAFLRDGDATGVISVNGLTGVVVLNGGNIDVIDPVDSTTKELNDALANIYASGGDTPDLQAVVTAGGVVISADGLKKVEIDKDNGQIIISTRPTTGDAWVIRAQFVGGGINVLSADGNIGNTFDFEGLKLQSSSSLGPTEYKNDRIIFRRPDDVDDFISRVLLLPTAYGIATDGGPYEFQKLALKPILTSYDFTAELGVDYEIDQDLTVTDPDDQVGSYRVFVANNNATIGGVAYPKGSRIYRYYDGTSWNTIVLATTDDIPTLDATPTNGSTNGVESNGVFDALALKADKSTTRQIIRSKNNGTFGSHTGNTAETVLFTIPINGDEFEIGDWMDFMFQFERLVTGTTISVRFRAGTNGNASDPQIALLTMVSATLDSAIKRERFEFNTGNILKGASSTFSASQSDIALITVARTSTSLNPSNNWNLTVTATLGSSSDTVICTGYQIGKTKTF